MFARGYKIDKSLCGLLVNLVVVLGIAANCIFFGQSFSIGYYSPICQLPEEAYFLNGLADKMSIRAGLGSFIGRRKSSISLKRFLIECIPSNSILASGSVFCSCTLIQ